MSEPQVKTPGSVPQSILSPNRIPIKKANPFAKESDSDLDVSVHSSSGTTKVYKRGEVKMVQPIPEKRADSPEDLFDGQFASQDPTTQFKSQEPVQDNRMQQPGRASEGTNKDPALVNFFDF